MAVARYRVICLVLTLGFGLILNLNRDVLNYIETVYANKHGLRHGLNDVQGVGWGLGHWVRAEFFFRTKWEQDYCFLLTAHKPRLSFFIIKQA